jgi:MFS family permease
MTRLRGRRIAGAAPTNYAWYVLTIFFFAAVLSYTDRLILNTLVEPIRRDLGITDTQISLLQGAAFAIIYAFIGLPMGRFADSHNRRNVVVSGVVLWSFATAACGFAGSFAHFFIARMFVGLGEAALAPAVMSMIPDYFPAQRRGTAIGVFLTGMAIGGGFAAGTGGLLLGVFQSGALAFVPVLGRLEPWRAVLVSSAAPGLVIAALLLTVREPGRVGRLTADAKLSFAATVAYFARHRRLFVFMIGAFALLQVIDYGFSAWLPALLHRRFGEVAAVAGPRIGLVSVVFGGTGTLLGGVLADRLEGAGRLDARLRITFLAVLCALPTFAFPLLPSSALVLSAYALYALTTSIGLTAGLAAVQDAVPGEMRGFAVSLQAFAYTLFGLGVGPTVVAFVTEHLYNAPSQVGLAMVTVAFPAGILTLAGLAISIGPYRDVRRLLTSTPPFGG